MSSVAYTGLMRSGKSYGVMENVILPALKLGRTVVHNMTLNEEAIRKITPNGQIIKLPEDFTSEQLVDLCPAGAYVVIDECWKYFPAGKTVDEVGLKTVSYVVEHGHRVGADGNAQELVFITQDLSMIAKWCRELIQYTYRTTKLETVGQPTRYRIDVYEGPVSGANPPAKLKIREMFGKYEPAVYACYKSHTMSVTGQAGKEIKADGRANIFKTWRFKTTVIAGLLLPFLIWKAAHSFQDLGEKTTKKAQVTQQQISPALLQQQPQQTTSVHQEPPKPKRPEYSTMWRLLGVVVRSDGSGTAVLTSAVGRRRLETRNNCSEDSSHNWTCLADGEKVTMWSGTSYSTGYSAQVPEGTLTAH